MAGTSSSKRPRRKADVHLREAGASSNRPLTPAGYRSLRVPSSSAIVVDFGSSALRAGFSTDSDTSPRLNFPPYVGRGRETGANGLYSLVGYDALASANRSSARSPFDGSVPNNASLVERLLDGVLLRLGLAEEDSIDHPVVITEPVCQPNGVRAQFTELMFEAYQVPKLCFGIDALFSYFYNGHESNGAGGLRYARRSGIVVSCGYNSTHVLGVHEHAMHGPGTKRVNIGGHHLTNNLARRLQLRHPDYASLFTYSRAEALKHDLCFVSEDYDTELAKIRDDVETYDQTCKIVQMPASEGPGDKLGMSAEEQERVKQSRIERGRRLSEMMKERNRAKAQPNAAAKKAAGNGDGSETDAPVVVAEEEAAPLLSALAAFRELEIIQETRETDEDLYFLARVAGGFETESAFEESLAERSGRMDEERRKLGEAKAVVVDAQWEKKRQEDELILVPDSDLTAQGLKRKRHLRALRGAAEARRRIKREKELEKLREVEREQEKVRAREENPEEYLAALRKERAEIADKVRRRKAAKDAGSDRRSVAARQRMRLLAQHAGNTGLVDDGPSTGKGSGKRKEKAKNNDTFGMNDSDWDVYRDMRVREDVGEDESENDSSVDRARLEKLREEISEMAPDEDDPTLVRRVGSALLYVPHPYADEVPVVVERLSTPEALFRPSLHGLEQCGIVEAIELIARGFSDPSAREQIVQEVFLTGGVAWTAGLEARMRRELVTRMPSAWGDAVSRGVRRAQDPQLDAWRGARLFASEGGSSFENACIAKNEYEELGPDYMREHGMSNVYVPTPSVDPVEAERRKKLQSYRRTFVK